MNMQCIQGPYPTHAFHNAIRDALLEVQRNLQVHPGLVGGPILSAMSIASQGDIDVQLPTGQIRPVVLYVATIADSGERKTATDGLVLAPIYNHDAAESTEFASALATYQAEFRYWDTLNTSLERKVVKAVSNGEETEPLRRELIANAANEPCKPERYRIVYQSVTERPLMDALHGDGRRIAIVSDEGEIVLKGGAMRKLAPLNKVWDGPKVLTFDRADDTVEVNNPRVTLNLMVQEQVLKEFLDERGYIARASGFLARFLFSWPASTQGYRYMSLDLPVWDDLKKFQQRVTELLAATDARHKAGDKSRKVLSFSPEAKELWVQVQNGIEPRLQPGGPLASVRDFASKSLEITGRVAAILHHFTGQEGDVISMETLQRALDIVRWYFDEFIRLFGDGNDEPPEQKDVRVLFMYLHARYWARGFPVALRNEVRKCGPIRHQGRFEAAIQRLIWGGSITVFHEDAEKRKGKLWIQLNPAAFGQVVVH